MEKVKKVKEVKKEREEKKGRKRRKRCCNWIRLRAIYSVVKQCRKKSNAIIGEEVRRSNVID